MCRNTLKCIVTEAAGLCRDTVVQGTAQAGAGRRRALGGTGARAPGSTGARHGGRWARGLSAPCARPRPTGYALGAPSFFLTQF